MSLSRILIFMLAIVVVVTVVWIYLRRELPVRGRGALVSARLAVLLLLLLLVWNPGVPEGSGSVVGASTWLLLDASLSMTAAAAGDSTPWARGVRRARSREWAGVLTFGSSVGVADEDSLSTPSGPESRLIPALRRAAEAGARSVTVVTDGRLSDGTGARALASGLGLELEVELLGGRAPSAGIADFSLPSRVRSGEALEAEVAVFAGAEAEGDSLTLEIREAGRLVASRRLVAPSAGRQIREALSLPPARDSGAVRYEASVILREDAFSSDDRRVAWVRVGPEERGVVLLSLRPDWEPRFLLPLLGRVSALPTRGFLRMGDGRYLTLAGSGDAPEAVSQARAAAALGSAEILVVHGLAGGEPSWVAEAAAGAPRLIVFPRSRDGAAQVGVRTGSPLPGEWFVTDRLPSSSLGADLAGAELSRLPPLTAVLPLTRMPGADVPLTVQRQGSGPEEAALTLVSEDGARRVVALGSGFWQWAFREGDSGETYRRLWSGAVGWLLADEPPASGAGVAPRRWVIPRGSAVSWQARGAPVGDTLLVRVLSGDSLVVDTTAVVGESGFHTGILGPGFYDFTVARARDGREVGGGSFDVEAFTKEMLGEPVSADSLATGGVAAAGAGAGRRPLRTHPLPYVLVLVLLCAEWIGRRRRGLR